MLTVGEAVKAFTGSHRHSYNGVGVDEILRAPALNGKGQGDFEKIPGTEQALSLDSELNEDNKPQIVKILHDISIAIGDVRNAAAIASYVDTQMIIRNALTDLEPDTRVLQARSGFIEELSAFIDRNSIKAIVHLAEKS
jgi:hypothetical protein